MQVSFVGQTQSGGEGRTQSGLVVRPCPSTKVQPRIKPSSVKKQKNSAAILKQESGVRPFSDSKHKASYREGMGMQKKNFFFLAGDMSEPAVSLTRHCRQVSTRSIEHMSLQVSTHCTSSFKSQHVTRQRSNETPSTPKDTKTPRLMNTIEDENATSESRFRGR